MNYEVVIGLEIHCELKTKSKMFSSAPLGYGFEPNTLTNPTNIGYPGALPVVNKQAVELAIIAANSLNMDIAKTLYFDRKNYFYSDLAKGYQITQDKNPLGSNGFVLVKDENGNDKKIELERMHIEEDTAKQLHENDATKIDYNRSGNPLVELVTKPVIKSAKEASQFVNFIRDTFEFLGISDAKMEEGSLRCDLNISLMEKGSKTFGTKVEVKNMNSVANLEKAIEFEINRQSKMLDEKHKISQETRRWDDTKEVTVSMREKNEAINYRYISEVNIRPIELGETFIAQVIEKTPLSSKERRAKYISMGLGEQVVDGLLLTVEISDYFDSAEKMTGCKDQLAKIIVNELKGSTTIDAKELVIAVEKFSTNELTSRQLKDLLVELEKGGTTLALIESMGLKQVSDTSELEAIIKAAVDADSKGVERYSAQPDVAINSYMGAVMKATKGQANPQIAREIIKAAIEAKIK